MLATSSAVFYAMFYGNLAQKESTIRITDADEESFNEFLRFLYTDDCKITAENAIGVMYLAKKYLISSLAEKCCKVLKASIKSDNVFAVLEQAAQFHESDLEAKCWDIVSRNTLECVNSGAFCGIRSHTLNALLKRDTLVIEEVDLFKAVLEWVDNGCATKSINIEDDKTARRRILGVSVYEIRFLEMSLEEFAKYVPPTGLLTDEETISIFRAFGGVDVAGLKWKDQKKRQPCTIGFSRFELANIIGTWSHGGNNFAALSFSVNKAVLFHGVRLFGDTCGSQYEVKLTIKDKDKNVTGTYISKQDSSGVWGYDIMLPKPILLLPDRDFTIIVAIVLDESQTLFSTISYRGKNGKTLVKEDDIVVTFKDAPSGLSLSGNPITNKKSGQFYKIFLSSV